MTDICEKQRVYQATLEHVRVQIEHGMEDTNDLLALEAAERERDIAWLRHTHSQRSPSQT